MLPKLLTTSILALAMCAPLKAEIPQPRSEERAVIIGDRSAPSLPPPANEMDLRRAFAPASDGFRKSVVRIMVAGQQATLGTIVSADGKILTKASELRGPATARLPDGRALRAEVLAIAKEHDLALLKVDAKDLSPVPLENRNDPALGQWLAAVGPAEVPMAVGVVSVERRVIVPDVVLGVLLADSEKPGARVMDVLIGLGAAKAGMLVDDLIIAIEDEIIENQQALKLRLTKMRPGQTISVRVQRGDEELKLAVTLTARGSQSMRTQRQNTMGGKLSTRRTGFPAIFQHDMVNLQPSECGSPVVTLDGQFAGINIARAGRPETYAIPASVVAELLVEFNAGKYAVPAAQTTTASNKPSANMPGPGVRESASPTTGPTSSR